ncbi:MAG: GAK system XXXCH domain-containing protein, partial [Desulfobacterales bacterium]|nr:GAK system XXXCH domain-containing protein [Desulfobacterales bacterium]
RFYQDSIAMCSYRDKGEEFYKAYLEQTEAFIKAFKASDLNTFSSAITSLNKLKKQCHDKYK